MMNLQETHGFGSPAVVTVDKCNEFEDVNVEMGRLTTAEDAGAVIIGEPRLRALITWDKADNTHRLLVWDQALQEDPIFLYEVPA